MKKQFLYMLLAFASLSLFACKDDDPTVAEGDEVPEREFMTMFRKDHNTNKGDSEPYAVHVEDLNTIQLYWYGVHGCAGYQVRVALSANVTSGVEGWEDSAANGRLVLDTIVGPEVLDLRLEHLEYSTDYRFAIRTLSTKGEGYHSKWYGYGDGRHWADWCGLTTEERYLTPELLQWGEITKTSIELKLDLLYETAGDDAVGTMKEHFEIGDDGNFVVHYLTVVPSPTNPNATVDPKWSHYDLTADDLARGSVVIDGLQENSVYVINAVNKNIPIRVDANYNTIALRTNGEPGEPIRLAYDELYNPNDTIPGATTYKAARLDQWLEDYTANAELAEGSIFNLDGGKVYYFYSNPTLCKGFTLRTNPDDIKAGKGNAIVYLNGMSMEGNTPRTCNFMFGRQPQQGEADAPISVKALVFEDIDFDCPLAQNYGDGSGTGNYFANMYSNGMGVVFDAIEVRRCTFQRMIRGFIRVQGSKRKVFQRLLFEDCLIYNCGYYDNNGRGYAWIAGDGASAKSNIFGDMIFRRNTIYDSPHDNFFSDNNKDLAWPSSIQYRITLENNTFVNFSTRSSGRYLFAMRYLPSGSVITVKNNLFIQTKKDGDSRNLYFCGMDIRNINGAAQQITFDVADNYSASCEDNRQGDDKIFTGGAFSAKSNSAGKFTSYLPGVINGADNLVVKQVKAADGTMLKPVDIFTDPNPPFMADHADMHEISTEQLMKGMKVKMTDAVRNSEIFRKKIGDPRWYE